MKEATLVLLTLAVGSLFVCGSPALTGDSSFSLTLDAAGAALVIDAALAVEASWNDLTTDLSLVLDENGPTTLANVWSAALGTLTLSADVAFDVQSTSFTRAGGSATIPGESHVLTLTAVLESGFGLMASIASEGVLHTIDIGLNLDRFGHVQTDSCALPFTYAAAAAAIPIAGCRPVDAELLFAADGFAELLLSCGGIAGLPIGVQFATILVFKPDAKTLDLSPSFSIEGSECFDLYAGLSWDATTHTISGVEIYGFGLRCELGTVHVRGLWSLDPSTFALVKTPYWALLGLVWDLPGCCGDAGEGSVAVFFDTASCTLFDVGEIEGEIVLPISDAATLAIGAALPVSGNAVFSVSWNVAF